MTAIQNSYHYGIEGSSKIATHFYPLEKAAKISYRVIDLTALFIKNLPLPFLSLSSQIKDLILTIESTRFFCVSFPLFFKDKQGKTFFQTRNWIQCAERITLTAHLTLKTMAGADRVGLIRLGRIGTYALGNMPIFRWALEGFILMYNFFGSLDASKELHLLKNKIAAIQNKMQHTPPEQLESKQRKWESKKNNLQFQQTKAWLKIAATVSKLVLITFAVSLAAVNIANTPCLLVILSLGVISDGIGMLSFYHQEYYRP
jgi:hypothetical protein